MEVFLQTKLRTNSGKAPRVRVSVRISVMAIAWLLSANFMEVVAQQPSQNPKAIIVTGAAGENEYAEKFRQWAERWVAACDLANISVTWIDGTVEGEVTEKSDKSRLLEALATADNQEMWLVLIGHGTFDGKIGKFNLRGEDISGQELSNALADGKGRQVIVNCFSGSGAFLPILSKSGRIVISSTRSGTELNFSRFGDYLSQALQDDSADLDHDGSVSILEAFLLGAKRTAQFYAQESRLATEHALLEDGGDGKGVPAEFFRGVRLVKQANEETTVDGELSQLTVLIPSVKDSTLLPEQLRRRQELESQLFELRRRKSTISEDEYYSLLSPIALELARLNSADGL